MLMKITRDTFTKSRIPVLAQVGIAAVAVGSLVFGGIAIGNGVRSAQAEQHSRTVAAAEAAAEQEAAEDAMYQAAAAAKKELEAAAEATYQEYLAAKAAAEAKAAADAKAAEDARIAAEAQAAADAAAKAATKAPSRSSSNSTAVVKCPAGTKANAVDAAGNESACEPLGAGGEQCQAYDENNNCTNWYKP